MHVNTSIFTTTVPNYAHLHDSKVWKSVNYFLNRLMRLSGKCNKKCHLLSVIYQNIKSNNNYHDIPKSEIWWKTNCVHEIELLLEAERFSTKAAPVRLLTPNYKKNFIMPRIYWNCSIWWNFVHYSLKCSYCRKSEKYSITKPHVKWYTPKCKKKNQF